MPTLVLIRELNDVIYFIKKGEVDKALKILDSMIKRYAPKSEGDPC